MENFMMALESIKANKLRSILTMLGIIIGISSVIAVVSLGSGGKNRIIGEFEKMGVNNININLNSEKGVLQSGDYITLKDVEAIRNKISDVKYVSPIMQQRGIISSSSKTKTASITAGNEELSQINTMTLLYGRFFSRDEVMSAKAVVILDENTTKNLFGYVDAVGNTVKVGPENSSKEAVVIGVTKSEMRGSSREIANVEVPITFLQTLYTNGKKLSSLTIMASSKENADFVGKSAVHLLESRHNNAEREVYIASNLMDKLTQVNNVMDIFTTFIAAVAGISLLVGGIGVMNIMLVSVTERTREIGIRKALGATTKNILIQFLTESAIISLIGGIIGLLLGYTGSQLVGLIVGIIPAITIFTVAGVILFSSAIGIFFGIYPAKKAANLDPIEALRYE